jgi:2-C-methyl-D-erythritol 4-phosphate cytidylyltransferase
MLGSWRQRVGRVTTVAGADEAFKVTRPLDLVLAEALLRGPSR